MIDYQTVESPFYEVNKQFLEECVGQLPNFSFSGWCNGYGFDVEGKSAFKQLEAFLQLKKHQTTQNGIFIPLDAHVNTEIHIELKGLNSQEKLAFGFNWFQSLLFGKQSNASTALHKQLADFSKTFQPRQLKLKNGTLSAKFYNTHKSPIEILEELYSLLNIKS